jgi:aryl-alcohol dehydrogenase-like predicted oxidoreductase
LVNEELLYNVVDVLDEIAKETEKSIAQVALNWLMHRPTVCNIVMGARNEEQLRQNLGAINFYLSSEQIKRLDQISRVHPIYPYWHQMAFDSRNPKPTKW